MILSNLNAYDIMIKTATEKEYKNTVFLIEELTGLKPDKYTIEYDSVYPIISIYHEKDKIISAYMDTPQYLRRYIEDKKQIVTYLEFINDIIMSPYDFL